jgi:hypothetical protein
MFNTNFNRISAVSWREQIQLRSLMSEGIEPLFYIELHYLGTVYFNTIYISNKLCLLRLRMAEIGIDFNKSGVPILHLPIIFLLDFATVTRYFLFSFYYIIQ